MNKIKKDTNDECNEILKKFNSPELTIFGTKGDMNAKSFIVVECLSHEDIAYFFVDDENNIDLNNKGVNRISWFNDFKKANKYADDLNRKALKNTNYIILSEQVNKKQLYK